MSLVLRLIRRLAKLPGLRRLTEVGPLMRVSLSLRASLVSDPWRFAWNELWPGRRETLSYRLRESGVAITIRHKSPDVLILDEVFSQQEYRLPEPVATRLAELEGPLMVADLGANIGLFGAWVVGRFPDAEIIALEPDPANAEVHRVTIEQNGRAATWRLIEAAAMTSSGTVHFSVGQWATSHVARSGESGIEVEGVDVFPLLADADLLKIDIEGGEWPILSDPRLGELDAAVLVLEYHPEGSPDANPARAAEALLAKAGFSAAADYPKDTGTGVLWALKSSS